MNNQIIKNEPLTGSYIIRKKYDKSSNNLGDSFNIYVHLKDLSDNVYLYKRNNGDCVVIKKSKITDTSHIKEILIQVVLSRGYKYVHDLFVESSKGTTTFIVSLGSIPEESPSPRSEEHTSELQSQR